MIWQDVLLMFGGFGFSVALLPSVLRKVKMPLSTTSITGAILTSYLVAYATLDLWLAFISGCVTAGMWWYLFWIGVRAKR